MRRAAGAQQTSKVLRARERKAETVIDAARLRLLIDEDFLVQPRQPVFGLLALALESSLSDDPLQGQSVATDASRCFSASWAAFEACTPSFAWVRLERLF